MKLYHRTNYWGKCIEASEIDGDVPFPAIWVQAVDDDEDDDYPGGCCRGFGRRLVEVRYDHFTTEHGGEWNLFKVNEQYGDRSTDHYFYKFALVPKGTVGYGRRGCERMGWTYEGSVRAKWVRYDLDDLLSDYLDDDESFAHFHIAVMMDELWVD